MANYSCCGPSFTLCDGQSMSFLHHSSSIRRSRAHICGTIFRSAPEIPVLHPPELVQRFNVMSKTDAFYSVNERRGLHSFAIARPSSANSCATGPRDAEDGDCLPLVFATFTRANAPLTSCRLVGNSHIYGERHGPTWIDGCFVNLEIRRRRLAFAEARIS